MQYKESLSYIEFVNSLIRIGYCTISGCNSDLMSIATDKIIIARSNAGSYFLCLEVKPEKISSLMRYKLIPICILELKKDILQLKETYESQKSIIIPDLPKNLTPFMPIQLFDTVFKNEEFVQKLQDANENNIFFCEDILQIKALYQHFSSEEDCFAKDMLVVPCPFMDFKNYGQLITVAHLLDGYVNYPTNQSEQHNLFELRKNFLQTETKKALSQHSKKPQYHSKPPRGVMVDSFLTSFKSCQRDHF